MRIKRAFRYLLLAAVLLLCACGQDEAPVNETQGSSESRESYGSESAGLSSEQNASEEADTPPAPGMVRSRLTNEWIREELADRRPIAVMIPNEYKATPHYALSEASVLYEAPVEGRMTRLMAVFEDWESLEKIGNIRSVRSYYVYWAFEWDACIIHAGQPFFVNDLLSQPLTETLSESKAPDSQAFYRDPDRSMPHNAYATGKGILAAMQKKNYSLTYHDYAASQHFSFASEKAPNTLEQYGESAQDATYIDMSSCYPLTRCYFTYNPEDGLYYRYQHLSSGTDGPHLDGADGEQLAFRNILVQNIKYEDLGEGYLVFQCHDTTEDGWFFTNGRGIHVTWEKTADFSPTRFYDDDGNEVMLNTGKTMICVVQKGSNFTFR